jgi:hypothetical protein
MKNLNAEQVKKALECCVKAETHLDCRKLKCPALINDECIYIGETDEDCDRQQLADALALITSQEQRIKELTEENAEVKANWQKLKESHESACEKCRAEFKRLTEENERFSQSLANSKSILANSKADTVRKMQERLIAEIENAPNANEFFITAWRTKIDQIAKEMLEGDNEN